MDSRVGMKLGAKWQFCNSTCIHGHRVRLPSAYLLEALVCLCTLLRSKYRHS